MAAPERLYVILDGTVIFQGGPGPFQYSIGAVASFLRDHLSG